jgi:hypothetical protein
MSRTARRALVLGVSGATWNVAGPLLASGRLPNLQRLVRSGCSATMLSVRAPGDKHYRPQIAWTTVATGQLPNVHGVTAFYHTADECRSQTLWDVFQSHGLRSGVFYWPLTWPPKPIDGFNIPCYHARDTATWPRDYSWIKRLDLRQRASRDGREPGVALRLREYGETALILSRGAVLLEALPALATCASRMVLSADPEIRSLGLRHGKLEASAAMFRRLCRDWKPDLATFHSFLIDSVSHRYWRYREPATFDEPETPRQRVLATAIDDAYIRTDRVLGSLLKQTPPDTVVAVVSEHGMAPEPNSNEVGTWQYMIRGAHLLRLTGLAEDLVSMPIARWICCNPRPGRTLPRDAASRLREVHVVETGLPLFQVHEHAPAETIVKFSLNRDVQRYRDGDLDALHIGYRERTLPFGAIARRAGRQRSAMHDARGMFILAGPGIRSGFVLPDCSIADFAPTLLAAAGLHFSAPCYGRILAVFSEHTQARQEPLNANAR